MFRLFALPFLILVTISVHVLAQDRQVGRARTTEDARGKTVELDDVPDWLANHDFPQSTFTFVRVQYDSAGRYSTWATDYPDADLNLAAQVGSMTKLDCTLIEERYIIDTASKP